MNYIVDVGNCAAYIYSLNL